MASIQQIQLPVTQRLATHTKVVETIVVNSNNIVLTFADSKTIAGFNGNLEQQWSLETDLSGRDYVYPAITVHPGGQLLGITNINSVRLIDTTGKELFAYKHANWEAFLGADCFFSGNYVLFITPSEEGDLLMTASLDSFEIKHSYQLEGNQEYHYSFFASPDPGIVILDMAAGQEESRLFSIEIYSDGTLNMEEIISCEDRIFGSFSPSGQEFVTAPHYDEELEVHSFPEMEVIASVSQEELFEGREEEYPAESDDGLNYHAMYLDDNTLLTITRFGRLLLTDRSSMLCTGELILEGCGIKAYDIGGEPVQEGAEIEDYEGEVSDVQLLDKGKLLVKHKEGELRIYHF